MRMHAWIAAFTGLATLAVGGFGCADPPSIHAAALIQDLYGSPRARLMLVGDAGDRDYAGRVLPYVVSELDRDPGRTGIVFLGDNVYPGGLPSDCQMPDCDEARSLDLQLDLAAHAGGLRLFVPGNHDWGDGGIAPLSAEEGLRRVERASERIAARGAEQLPPPGCPGPAVRELGDGALRVIAIDSQWWLMSPAERQAASRGRACEGMDEGTTLAALEAALTCDREPCPARVVVAHHPLVSYGPHGGRFPWYRHVLPPLFGSAYVWLRQGGFSRQDLSSEAYQHYVREVGLVMDRHSPLAFLAGHEHAIQVIQQLERIGTAHVVTGIGRGTSWVTDGPGSRYASSGPGVVELDVYDRDRVLLRVLEVSGTPPTVHETFFRWLR